MTEILSNTINDNVYHPYYNYDKALVVYYSYLLDKLELPAANIKAEQRLVVHRHRNPQTKQLLERLRASLMPCLYPKWLAARGISDISNIYSINYDTLSDQDLLDLYIYPDDHILDAHGEYTLDGPTFLDERDGNLVGICTRNVSKDLSYVKDAKYTFSNFGWFLYGYDLYSADDTIMLVEGVFDAIAMRKFGYNAIAIGSSMPQVMQLACLRYKYKNITVCFDNDLFGHYGAYVASNILNTHAVFTELKDASYHLEGGLPLNLWQPTNRELKDMVYKDVDNYNSQLANGTSIERQLPYNR